MCNALQVRWTIVSKIAPQPWIACSGCGGFRAFRSSGKIRLNANGRKLDAWLIYKCVACEKTWNRPILERQNVRDIDPVVLAALHANDPELIRAEAFNLEALRRKSRTIDEFADVEVRKQLLRDAPAWKKLDIELSVPLPTCLRLDRLLSSELDISRMQVTTLRENALLRTNPDRADILRRPVKNGLRVTLDLADLPDRELVWKPRAIGSMPDL